MTTVKIDIPDDQAATLKAKAMAQGLTLEGWFQRIAAQEAPVGGDESVVQEMRRIRARVRLDPEGWTIRDYVNHGRGKAQTA